jgi:hypothetical protein
LPTHRLVEKCGWLGSRFVDFGLHSGYLGGLLGNGFLDSGLDGRYRFGRIRLLIRGGRGDRGISSLSTFKLSNLGCTYHLSKADLWSLDLISTHLNFRNSTHGLIEKSGQLRSGFFDFELGGGDRFGLWFEGVGEVIIDLGDSADSISSGFREVSASGSISTLTGIVIPSSTSCPVISNSPSSIAASNWILLATDRKSALGLDLDLDLGLDLGLALY